MEVLQREIFFSKQGKSSAHNHSILFNGKKRRPTLKELNLIDPSDTESLERARVCEKKEKVQKHHRPDASFRSVSRDQRSHAFRNKTDSPVVGLYSPKYDLVFSRASQGPTFKTHSSKPRKIRMEIPNCLDSDLRCSFPKHNRCKPRETLTVSEIEQKIRSRKNICKSEPKPFIQKVNFGLQSPRKPFVSEKDPPDSKRFSYVQTTSLVFSGNKRPRSVIFKKMVARKELIDVQPTVGPYEMKEELVRPRTDLDVPSFKLMQSRKPLLLKERLLTPDSPSLDRLERAFSKQSHVRGVKQIPKIGTMAPRDDSMYRTTEAYSLNTSKYLKISAIEL
jgi:hypothetical protein